ELLQALAGIAKSDQPLAERIRSIDLLGQLTEGKDIKPMLDLLADPAPEVRAQAVLWLGISGAEETKEPLFRALLDKDALVKRRACEALIRAGFEPPAAVMLTILGDSDRFLRTAARLVLQRIDPEKWFRRAMLLENDLLAWEAIVALCKTDKAARYTDAIFER